MNLYSFIYELPNVELIQKYTITQIRQYQQIHQLRKENERYVNCLEEIIQNKLVYGEARKLLEQNQFPLVYFLESVEDYIQTLEDTINTNKRTLAQLPSLPEEFIPSPPLLATTKVIRWVNMDLVHDWFAQHIQDEVDYSKEYLLSYELLRSFQQVLNQIFDETTEEKQWERANELLSYTEEVTSIDDAATYGLQELKRTKELIDSGIRWEALKNNQVAYLYQATW